MSELILIDLPAIVHRHWHILSNASDPNATSIAALAHVRQIALRCDHVREAPLGVAICLDSPPYDRATLDPTYKANRPKEDREPLWHQMRLVSDALNADGFPVWASPGCEADDIIASATARALDIPGTTVRIVTSDKDLLALVGERVVVERVAPAKDGGMDILDAAGVRARFGVEPGQMVDYLTLVGDTSDNIKGCEGVGAVTAAKLLGLYGTLEGIYQAKAEHGTDFTPALATRLTEFAPRVDDVRNLIRLRRDVPIPFEEIAVVRTAPPMEGEAMSESTEAYDEAALGQALDDGAMNQRVGPQRALVPAVTIPASRPAAPAVNGEIVGFERQLEPRSLDEAKQLAKFIFDSKLWGAYGTPQAVLMTVMAGREFGLQAMASLRAFHIVQGKPVLAADAIRALVLKSGLVSSFRCTERTPDRATFTAKRGDDPEISLTYTMAEAQAAGLLKPGSGWSKFPADMLVARAGAKLARLVAPEVTFGLYAPEELE